MDPILAIAASLVLVVLAALSSAAEASLATLSRSELEEIAATTTRSAARMAKIAEAHRRHQDALALAHVGALILLAAIGSLSLNALWQHPWLALGVTALGVLAVHILFVGSFPRALGANRPRETVVVLSRFIRAVLHLLGWVSDLLRTIGDVVIPASRTGVASPTSEDQLLSIVDEAAEQEVLAVGDRDRIHSLLGFADRMVREVMVPRTDMRTVAAGTSIAQATRELLDNGISRAPIVGRDSDDIRGVAYLKDLAKALATGSGGAGRVESVARPAVFVPETLGGDVLLQRMQREATHFAIVIDEYGGVAGLVTLEDLIEELIGEISDEHDRVDHSWDALEDGSLRVATRMSISELEDLLDATFDHEDVDSVGGLFTSALDRIPVLTDRGQVGDFIFIADRVGRKHHVTHVRILRADGGPLVRQRSDDNAGEDSRSTVRIAG